jgi:hypothetical protein
MKGVTPKKPEDGAKPITKVPGKKGVKSSKFEVSKDEKTGSYCMDPLDKETGKRIAPHYTLIWLHGHDSSAMREFT